MTAENILEKMLTPDYLKVERGLIKGFQSILLAAFVGELFYRYKRIRDDNALNDGFFYYTRKEMENELFISDSTQKKYTDMLVDMNLLETKLQKTDGKHPRCYYKLKFENILELISKNSKKNKDIKNESK